MIVSQERRELISLIENLMDGKIPPDEFRTRTLRKPVEDPTVKGVLEMMEEAFFETDLSRLDRFSWKLLNRFRLLLVSEAELEPLSVKRRSMRQGIALGLLGGGVFLALCFFVPVFRTMSTGMFAIVCAGYYLFLMFACLMLGYWEDRSWDRDPAWIKTQRRSLVRTELFRTYPFESFGEILALRKTVPGFQCKKYRNPPPGTGIKKWCSRVLRGMDLEIRIFPECVENAAAKILSPLSFFVLFPLVFFVFAIATPFLLIFQCFPESRYDLRLKLPPSVSPERY